MSSADEAINKALNSNLLNKFFADESKFTTKSNTGGSSTLQKQVSITKTSIVSARTSPAPSSLASRSTTANGTLEHQIELLKKEVIKHTNEAHLLRADLKVAKHEAAEYPSRIAALEKEVRQLQQQLAHNKEAYENQTKLRQLAETDLKIAKHDLEEARRAGPATNDTVTHLQDRIVQTMKRKVELEASNAQLKRELDHEKKLAQEAQNRLTDENRRLVKELMESRGKLSTEVELDTEHMRQIEVLSSQIDKLQQDLKVSHEKCDALEEEKRVLKRELSTHTGNDLLEAQTRAKELEKEDLALQIKVRELQKELDSLRETSKQYEKEEIERVSATFTQKMAELEKTNQAQHVHILRLQREAAHDKTAGLERAEQERDSALNQVAALEERIRSLERDLAVAKSSSSAPPPAPPVMRAGGGPPPPPPMSGLKLPKPSTPGGAGAQALFADINKGGFKLRKVPQGEIKRPVSPKQLAKGGGASNSPSGGIVSPTGNSFMDELRRKQASMRK